MYTVSVDVTTVIEVKETTTRELLLPYYGRSAKRDSMVAITPVMYPHLPEQLHYVIVTSARRKAGETAKVEVVQLKSYPTIPAKVLAFIEAHEVASTENEVGHHIDRCLVEIRKAV